MTESSFSNQQRDQREDRYGNLYGDITVSGNARVFLGNHYGSTEDDKARMCPFPQPGTYLAKVYSHTEGSLL